MAAAVAAGVSGAGTGPAWDFGRTHLKDQLWRMRAMLAQGRGETIKPPASLPRWCSEPPGPEQPSEPRAFSQRGKEEAGSVEGRGGGHHPVLTRLREQGRQAVRLQRNQEGPEPAVLPLQMPAP